MPVLRRCGGSVSRKSEGGWDVKLRFAVLGVQVTRVTRARPIVSRLTIVEMPRTTSFTCPTASMRK